MKLIAEPWDVGRRRLPGRQLPAAVDRVERQVPRHRPRLLAGRAAYARRVRLAADRLAATSTRATAGAVRLDQLRHCHDGFTLRDLVSYNDKHNEANGEGNSDGESHNRSWNCGVEGPTDDPEVLALRARQQRNFLATLLLSQGVPMILHGDELGRTQQGNNNVYCQDNELTLGGLGGRSTRTCWPSPGGCWSSAPITRSSGGGASSPATPRTTGCPTSPGSVPTGHMAADDWDRIGARAGRVPQRRRHHRAGTAR